MASTNLEVRQLTGRDHYAGDTWTVVRQVNDEQTTTLQFRRVRQEGATEDELQVEITIEKRGEKRVTSTHSSFIAPATLADVMGKACLDYSPNDHHGSKHANKDRERCAAH
jgi:hypothetical protein